MKSTTAENLYQLLPSVYRIRDAEQGEALKALIALLAEQAEVVEENIDQLYADTFIETCDEWVVPYIGDLLGVRALHPIGRTDSLRGYVANTLSFRRRKGTAPVLEQLARDVTGWTARAVEFFQLLDTSQHVNHVRLQHPRTPDMRDTNQLELLGSPFERAAHTAEVRRIAASRGTYNIPNIGIFLWRLQSYPLTRVSARSVTEHLDGRYTFHPLGLDGPLFNRPQTEREISHLAEEINVPGELRRRPLYDELEERRQALVDGQTPRIKYFGATPMLQVFIGAQTDPIPPENILICNLAELPVSPPDWQRPPSTKSYTRSDGTLVAQPIQVAVDPVLGRLAFPVDEIPSFVQVSYAYGFSADVGGGPYDRRESVEKVLTRSVDWQVGVSQSQPVVPDELFATLTEAVQAWNSQPAGTVGVIAILDSRTYVEDLTDLATITIPEGSQLLIVAADWPEVDVPGAPGSTQRLIGQLGPHGRRPHILGNLAVVGTAPPESSSPGALVLHGLLIEGALTVLSGNLGHLDVVHTTLIPGQGGIGLDLLGSPAQLNTQLRVSLERSICGAISLPDSVPQLHVVDSIIDPPGAGGGVDAILAPDTFCDIKTSTIFGRSRVHSLEASESIFADTINVGRRQEGCARFSYIPEGSQTPRRYRCQPSLAFAQRATELGLEGASQLPAAERNLILSRLRPAFTSSQYCSPSYAQLSLSCAEEIRTGAEDGSEMGVFSHLKQAQREANLRTSLEEYLRFGLEAGSFFVT